MGCFLFGMNHWVAKTGAHVVVNDPSGLEVGIGNGWSKKAKSSSFQVVSESGCFFGGNGDFSFTLSFTIDGLIADKRPEICGKGAKLFLHCEKGPGVGNSSDNLEFIPDDTRIL